MEQGPRRLLFEKLRSLEPDLVAETAGAMIGASIRLLPDAPSSQNGNGV
jgi:hypothetical protein